MENVPRQSFYEALSKYILKQKKTSTPRVTERLLLWLS